MHLIYFIYFSFVWCCCIMRSYVLMPASKSFLSMWGIGVRWSTDLPQQDKKLFAVVFFFSAPFVGIFAPSRAPPIYLLGFYGAFVVLQSRKMKMAFTALHACQGCWCCALFSESCCWILLRLGDRKAGTLSPTGYHWNLWQNPSSPFFLPSAARNTCEFKEIRLQGKKWFITIKHRLVWFNCFSKLKTQRHF